MCDTQTGWRLADTSLWVHREIWLMHYCNEGRLYEWEQKKKEKKNCQYLSGSSFAGKQVDKRMDVHDSDILKRGLSIDGWAIDADLSVIVLSCSSSSRALH